MDATFYSRHGHTLQAAAYLLRATHSATDPAAAASAGDSLDRACARLVDRWHFTMLNDRRRNAAFGRAVRRAAARLKEREVVLDVGAGTGLLSMMAARAGACPVYACEGSEAMCQVAAAALADNGLASRVQLVNNWSHQMTVGGDLPRRASLLITETFDAGLLGEHVLSTLQHAWRHLLLPPAEGGGGRVLPAAATVRAAAVQSGELRRQLTACLSSGERLRRKLREPYWSERLADLPGGYRLLSEPVQVYSVDFNDPESIERGLSGLEARHVIRCTADGTVDALVMWFELQLEEGETLSSAPEEGTCWEQAVYPVPAGVQVRAGQVLAVWSVCRGHLELRLEGVQSMDTSVASETAVTADASEDSGPSTAAEQVDQATQPPQKSENADVNTTNLTEISKVATITNAAMPSTNSAEEVTAEALAFANDTYYLSTLGISLRRWLTARPPNRPRPRLLDLCPLPLERLVELSGAAVARPDPAGAVVTRPDPAAAVAGRTGAEEAAGEGESWDGVLCAPVMPSGRLDPAVMKAVASVRLSEGGLLFPARLELVAVAISSRLLLDMTSVQPENTEGLDCSAINVYRVHQLQDFPYRQRAISTDLSDTHIISTLDLATGATHPPRFTIPVTSGGALHGLVYWFRPADGSSGSAARPPLGRRQMAAAVRTPRVVRVGDAVTGSVHRTEDGVFVVFDE